MTGRPWHALRTPETILSRLNGSVTPLRELDEVAYLRFASVYQAFESLEDFESAIEGLRRDHDGSEARA